MKYIRGLLGLYIFCVLPIFSQELSDNNQHVVMISIPKSGTHLLMKCIYLLTGRTSVYNVRPFAPEVHPHFQVKSEQDLAYLTTLPADKYWQIHLLYNQGQADVLLHNKCITFFMCRDPRDQVISFVHHMHKDGTLEVVRMSFNQAITDLITRGRAYYRRPVVNHDIYQMYQRYLPWISHPGILSVRFEDLVGPQGGGSLEKQIESVRAVANHLKLDVSAEQIELVARDLFGKIPGEVEGNTFRKGQIGSWKKYFTEEHKRLFKEIAGQLLIDLGYEQDLNW